MNITLLKLANNKAELSELGQMLDDPNSLSLISLIGPFQNLLNMLEDRVVTAALYHHSMPNQQHYHSIAVMDIDSIIYGVNDRQTISGLLGAVTMESEFEEAVRKSKYYDLIVKSGGTHKMRIILTDEQRKFIGEVNSRNDLERYLDLVSMEEYLKSPGGPHVL